MARKLKGINSKKITKKQEKTLKKMDKVRKKDNEVLRQKLLNKLIALKDNEKKCKNLSKDLNNRFLRTRGAIVVLEEILNLSEGD